jgi:uncharacterized membrane protein YdjX (TVP38/TMEM64 family)
LRAAVLFAVVVVGLAVLLIAGREALGLLPRFSEWVRELGPLGPLAFIAGYGAAAVTFFPAVSLTLAAGAIFGLGRGVLFVMIGATLGAALAFLCGRYVARRFVEHLLQRHPKLAAIDRAVESQGLRLVFLLRLSPAVPYVLLNYALGLSRVRFLDYIAGSIGMLPAVTMYVYTGKVAGDLASLASGAVAPQGATYYSLLGLGFVATVAVTIVVTRIARRAIDEAVDEPGAIAPGS